MRPITNENDSDPFVFCDINMHIQPCSFVYQSVILRVYNWERTTYRFTHIHIIISEHSILKGVSNYEIIPQHPFTIVYVKFSCNFTYYVELFNKLVESIAWSS